MAIPQTAVQHGGTISTKEMSVFDIISRFFTFIMEIVLFGRTKLSNTINIYIKSNTGSTISVDLDPKWDIKNVKEFVAPKFGLAPDDMKIIFAGKELLDSTVIEVSCMPRYKAMK